MNEYCLKKCSKCKIIKSILEFSFVKSKNDYNLQCKDCIRIIQKKYEEKVKIKRKEKREEKAKLTSKECTLCNEIKSFNEFYYFKDKKNDKKYYNSRCITCSQIVAKEFYEDNKIEINKNVYETRKNDEEYKKYHKEYREENKDHLKEKRQEYVKENEEKVSAQRKITGKKTYEKNKNKILEKQKNISKLPENKKKANDRKKKQREEIKQDPIKYGVMRIRENVSRMVRHALKKQSSSKKGISTFKYLPYTIEELKTHIELLWEDWMSWSNYGVYKEGGERKWQIDHIIPQSLLPYDTMDHPNFLKSWALENLRPLEAIENIKKGNKIIDINKDNL